MDAALQIVGAAQAAAPGPSGWRLRPTSVELDSVAGTVMILLQDRFTAVMDDPAMPQHLREFESALNTQKQERADIQASMAS